MSAFWHSLTLPEARHSLMASRQIRVSPRLVPQELGKPVPGTWPQERRTSPTVARGATISSS
jgi:hypothetical protein